MSPAGTTTSLYDLWDHLLAETDATGHALREYLWLGDEPAAVLDWTVNGSYPVLFYVHTDHLHRPEVMTDTSGNVVWKATYEPFGAVSTITGSVTENRRLPGQYFQLETGLSYNWNRHYDPTTGRFTTPDPLGIVAGASVYGYAGQTPLMHVDPSGLFDPAPLSAAALLALEEEVGGGGPEDPIADAAAVITLGSGLVSAIMAPSPGSGPGISSPGQATTASSGGSGGSNPKCNCPDCNPPVGTIRYRLDQVPPSAPHWPFTGDHVHLYQMNQNPHNCQCFWKKIGVVGAPPPPGISPM